MTALIYIPPTTSSVSSPEFFFYDSHYDWGEMESQCYFDLHFFFSKDFEHFIMYLLVTCLFNTFAHLLIELFFSCLTFWAFYIFWILIACLIDEKSFLPFLSHNSDNHFFWFAEFLNLMQSQILALISWDTIVLFRK
jgi:hypothetical protein